MEQSGVPDAQKLGEFGFKLIRETPGRKPEIQTGIDNGKQVRLIEDAPRNRYRRLARHKLTRGERLLVILCGEPFDLSPDLFLFPRTQNPSNCRHHLPSWVSTSCRYS